jgi:hypothetical protein
MDEQVFSAVPEFLRVLDLSARDLPFVLGVEGASFAGKTCLARQLAGASSAVVVSTDPYYRRGFKGRRYSEGLRLEDLRHDVERHLAEESFLVVEGLCLRDTLVGLPLEPDAFVYCKRVSAAGIWHDDPEFQSMPAPDTDSVQALIDRWSLEYHQRTKPHEKADFTFVRDGDAL